MKESAKTAVTKAPAISPELMFLRAVSRSTLDFYQGRPLPRVRAGP